MKDSMVFIKHIRDAVINIENFSKGVSAKEFQNNKLVQSAVVRQIEVIGEAAKNLPPGFRNKYFQVEWKAIAGMRDKLIHHYFGVDFEKVWLVVKKEIPKLKKEIKEILKKEGQN